MVMPPQQRGTALKQAARAPTSASDRDIDTPGIPWQRRACLTSLGLVLLLAGLYSMLRSLGGMFSTRAGPAGVGAGAASSAAYLGVDPLPTALPSGVAAQSASPSPLPPPLTPARVTAHTASSLIPTQWRIVRRVPHDPTSFTQGLVWRGRVLYEGSGMWNGASQLRRVSLAGGQYKVLQYVALAGDHFGEGVTLWPGEEQEEEAAAAGERTPPPTVFQLTWQNGKVYTYEADFLTQEDTLGFTSTTNEGWGLTHDGKGTLVFSDGSANLHFFGTDKAAYRTAKALVAAGAPVTVRHAGPLQGGVEVPPASQREGSGWTPQLTGGKVFPSLPTVLGPIGKGTHIKSLNELEWVHGWVLSNIWYDKHVAIIDPATGEALWYLDFSALYEGNEGKDCLNGLAYTMLVDAAAEDGADPAPAAKEAWGGRLWVTGKHWNFLYEVELGGLVEASTLRGARRRQQAGHKNESRRATEK
jgi:glutamine cyclotransferase